VIVVAAWSSGASGIARAGEKLVRAMTATKPVMMDVFIPFLLMLPSDRRRANGGRGLVEARFS
jgi:hypothetical protein